MKLKSQPLSNSLLSFEFLMPILNGYWSRSMRWSLPLTLLLLLLLLLMLLLLLLLLLLASLYAPVSTSDIGQELRDGVEQWHCSPHSGPGGPEMTIVI